MRSLSTLLEEEEDAEDARKREGEEKRKIKMGGEEKGRKEAEGERQGGRESERGRKWGMKRIRKWQTEEIQGKAPERVFKCGG